MKNYHETGTLPCLSRTRREPRGVFRIPNSTTCSQNKENFGVVLMMDNRRYLDKCWFYGNGMLCIRQWTLQIHKRRKISSPAHRQLASQEGFWFKEWDNRFRGRNW